MSTTIRPDVVIIGSGVGGAAVAHQLAGSGARVLILERGDYLPDEPEISDAESVFLQSRYRTTEEWQDRAGNRYRPGQYYFVGGHTKFYGTAMFRFRESDFKERQLEDVSSPAWPIGYADLEPPLRHGPASLSHAHCHRLWSGENLPVMWYLRRICLPF